MKTDGERARNGRRLYLDVLRAWACISVIVIHVCAYYAQVDVNGIDFLVGNALNSVARAAVPLFVMISGALTLDEQYRFTGEKLRRNIKNRVLFFAIWSSLYALVFHVAAPLVKGEAVSVQRVFESLLSGHHHLWFIPMLIGLSLILPLLRLWVKRENKQYVEYFLMLSLIFASVVPFVTEKLCDLFPAASCIYSLTDNLHLQYVAGFTGYYVLGWYLHNFPPKRRSVWYAAGALGLLLTFGGTQIFSRLMDESKNFYSVFATGIVGYSAALFVLAKSLFDGREHARGILCRFVRIVCDHSMGVYAIHAAIVQVLFTILGVGSAAVMIPLVTLVSFAVSLVATQVLRRIPFAREYMV